jgi:hypothetical protein
MPTLTAADRALAPLLRADEQRERDAFDARIAAAMPRAVALRAAIIEAIDAGVADDVGDAIEALSDLATRIGFDADELHSCARLADNGATVGQTQSAFLYACYDVDILAVEPERLDANRIAWDGFASETVIRRAVRS